MKYRVAIEVEITETAASSPVPEGKLGIEIEVEATPEETIEMGKMYMPMVETYFQGLQEMMKKGF